LLADGVRVFSVEEELDKSWSIGFDDLLAHSLVSTWDDVAGVAQDFEDVLLSGVSFDEGFSNTDQEVADGALVEASDLGLNEFRAEADLLADDGWVVVLLD